MIGIIDYGSGNISAFKNIYERAGIQARIVSESKDLSSCSHLILPGVGAFDWTMKKLSKSNLISEINYQVKERKNPILGICVGMIMAQSSDEGNAAGFGWFDTNVRKFHFDSNLPIPHMGWNNVDIMNKNILFSDTDNSREFYFLHSYYFDLDVDEKVICKSNYSFDFACAIQHENIFGVQFHPEKAIKMVLICL